MIGKKLTPEIIIQKAKSDKFEMIKNLNLWGNDLQDISIIRELSNVEVLSLSVNSISTLADFSYCHQLSELYLRKNFISNFSELKHLKNLQNLKVLWLCDNPCSNLPNYRIAVIKLLPQLVKLDNSLITEEERIQAQNLELNLSSPIKSKSSSPQKAVHESLMMPNEDQIRNPGYPSGNPAGNPPARLIPNSRREQRIDVFDEPTQDKEKKFKNRPIYDPVREPESEPNMNNEMNRVKSSPKYVGQDKYDKYESHEDFPIKVQKKVPEKVPVQSSARNLLKEQPKVPENNIVDDSENYMEKKKDKVPFKPQPKKKKEENFSENQDNNEKEIFIKKNSKVVHSPKSQKQIAQVPKKDNLIVNEPKQEKNRNENLLCAVLMIIKELDRESIEIVKSEIDRKLNY